MNNASDDQRQWVLIRGMMSESFHWWDFLPRIRESYPDDHFVTPDVLGNGRTGNLRTPLTLQRNVSALRSQVTSSGRKVIFGFSLGGILGLEWSFSHPEEVEALVLINVSLGNSPLHLRMRPSALSHILRFSLIPAGPRRDEQSLAMTTNLPRMRLKELAPHWAQRAQEFPVRPSNFFAQMLIAGQAKMRPAPPPVPILLLASGQDKVVNPECSRRIARAWNLPLHVHPTAGHDLSLEHPDWILEKLANWQDLQKRESQQPSIDIRSRNNDESVNP